MARWQHSYMGPRIHAALQCDAAVKRCCWIEVTIWSTLALKWTVPKDVKCSTQKMSIKVDIGIEEFILYTLARQRL